MNHNKKMLIMSGTAFIIGFVLTWIGLIINIRLLNEFGLVMMFSFLVVFGYFIVTEYPLPNGETK